MFSTARPVRCLHVGALPYNRFQLGRHIATLPRWPNRFRYRELLPAADCDTLQPGSDRRCNLLYDAVGHYAARKTTSSESNSRRRIARLITSVRYLGICRLAIIWRSTRRGDDFARVDVAIGRK